MEPITEASAHIGWPRDPELATIPVWLWLLIWQGVPSFRTAATQCCSCHQGLSCCSLTEAGQSNPCQMKHVSVLPGNTLYFSSFAQFSLPVCIGLPCYRMDHHCMVNQSLHIKCRGHLIWVEGVQVGLNWEEWRQQTLLLLCFFFSFLIFDILLFQLTSTNQEPAPSQGLSDWWSTEALNRNFLRLESCIYILKETILGNTLLHWMRVGLKKRRNGLLC